MTGKRLRPWLVVGLGLALLHSTTTDVVATSNGCRYSTSSGYSCAIEVSGDVAQPGRYTLHDIKTLLHSRQLAPATQNVLFKTGSGSTSAAWSGVLLWDFLQHVGITAVGRDSVKKIIEIVATDGYVIKLGAGELDPGFGGHQAVLTIYQDGELLGEDTGFARLIFPGDKSGARNIFWIKVIKIY
jgi:DMSO/TMAO reductase YedYZ molybdopterin-dependent catalytic subunit